MGTRKIYDLAVVTGSYESQGQTKHRYQNVGVVLEKDDGGKFIILESWFNPAGVAHDNGKGIMVSMFEPKQDVRNTPPTPDRAQQRNPAQAPSPDGFSDDIPFD